MQATITTAYWSVILSYVLWGFMPFYSRQALHVPLNEILMHRIIWSAVLLLFYFLVTHQLFALLKKITWRIFGLYAFSALCLIANWYLFIWGVNRGDITLATLGYFINPILSVLLGVFVLKERLRAWQVLCVVIVTLGVLQLTAAYGQIPWLAIAIAFSFGLYGLMKKIGTLDPLEGLLLEVLCMLPWGIYYFLENHTSPEFVFMHVSLKDDLLLFGFGIITILPLFFFNFGTPKISMLALGIIQYLGPTLQFLSGVVVFHEVINHSRFLGYLLVWIGCAFFTLESVVRARLHRS